MNYEHSVNELAGGGLRLANSLSLPAPMTAYGIISVFIGILALLISYGSLIVAIIAFLGKRNKRK